MKSSLQQIQSRREQLTSVLKQEGYLSVGALSERFLVSEATIRRDLNALEKENHVTRTYGGALSEYDAVFSSFQRRTSERRHLKKRIAKAATDLIGQGESVFLDAGCTVYSIAERIAEGELRGLTIVTNSIPTAEIVAQRGLCEVHLLGGHLLPHQLTVVGLGASLSLAAWRFDLSFFGAQGMDEDGLWNSRDAITDFQRHVAGRSRQSIFCVDESKLHHSAPSFLVQWPEVDRLITTASKHMLENKGIELDDSRLRLA